MALKAFNSFILSEKIELSNKSETGMIMGITQGNPYKKKKIVSVGNDCKDLKEGQIIYFPKSLGMELPNGNLVVKAEAIVAVEED